MFEVIDLLVNIAKYLSIKEIIKLECTNKYFRDIVINVLLLNREIRLDGIKDINKIKQIVQKYNINDIKLSYIDGDIISFFKYMRILDLFYCDYVTDNIIIHPNFKFLKTLNLSYCKKITDEGVKCLANLHTLYLSDCYNITDDGVKYLRNQGVIYSL